MPVLLDIPRIQIALREQGGVTLDVGNGQRVFIVLSRNLGLEDKGILVASEGGGTLFWDLRRTTNKFTFIKAGFSVQSAEMLSILLNSILSPISASALPPAKVKEPP